MFGSLLALCRCLFATTNFPKGSLVYQGRCSLVENVLNFTLRDSDDEACTRRQFYGFDGFMNHSCAPNLHCPGTERAADHMLYDAHAVRDIAVGDEITCDYSVLDYECDGHAIEVCGCGAPRCRGSMKGFKGLPLAEQVRVLHHADAELVEHFMGATNAYIYETKLLDGVGLACDDDMDAPGGGSSCRLVAAKDFEPGDVVFKNKCVLMYPEKGDLDKMLLLRVSNLGERFFGRGGLGSVAEPVGCGTPSRYFLLEPDHHCIHRPTHVEVIGFDIFMDHSCEPTTSQEYTSSTDYTVYATRAMKVGEAITCDYEQGLGNAAEGTASLETTKFQCLCDAATCRGLIRA